MKLQLLSTQIQQQIGKDVPTPSSGEISDYYNAAKSQFTQPATRDVRLVLNKDKAKVEQAKAALEKDSSTASWSKVAKQYSTDASVRKPTAACGRGSATAWSRSRSTATSSARPTASSRARSRPPSATTSSRWRKSTPETTQPLAQVQSQISSQLTQQAQQDVFSAFVANYGSKWQSRTFCASGYVIERCANFKGSGHPASAPPACYEANPKGGLPADCPAPVQQLAPALPGSVSILTPQGQRLPQRPQPAGLKPVPAAAASRLSRARFRARRSAATAAPRAPTAPTSRP